MKNYLLLITSLAVVPLAWAVPSEINYQGRLTDANGDAVTGDVAMSLKMFDAATDGNEIYSEDIGTVTLDSNGIYSFEFGASGQSVVSTSESIATTDGTSSIFNATLENLPVDGSVSISDGTYTWSQANGSSSSEFTASVTPSSGAVSAIYLTGAPASGVNITASYSYMDTTLSGALSSHASHWLELSVDGTAQSPRERVLSVPFAQVAGSALRRPLNVTSLRYITGGGWSLPIEFLTGVNATASGGRQNTNTHVWGLDPTLDVISIKGIKLNIELLGEPSLAISRFSLRKYNVSSGWVTVLELEPSVLTTGEQIITSTEEIPLNFNEYAYELEFTVGHNASGGGINSNSQPLAGGKLNDVIIEFKHY